MPDPADHFIALQEAVAGRYSLERELGRGGMGIVYLAREVALDRPVALKLLPPAMAADSALRERFLREARTAAKLSHPNIVPIYAVDEVDGFVFFVMAYINGQTLGQRIRERGPVPRAEAAAILRQVAWALGHAHAQGIVHRDVKPDNVLLEEESGRALVTDFGIAHVMAQPGMTGAGEILGTAEFMSPEQASGEEIDARSDIYSLGVLAFYMLSGRLPFESDTVGGMLAKHLTAPAPRLRELAPDAPRSLAAIVDRCLVKEPVERFADGQALIEAMGSAPEDRRDLPVPLRVFIKHNRESLRPIGVYTLLFLLFVFPSLLGGVVVGDPIAISVAIALGALLAGAPVTVLGGAARKLLKSGYGYDDAIRALQTDLERRREELVFEYGAKPSRFEKVARAVALGGLAGAGLSLAGYLFGVTPGAITFPFLGMSVTAGLGAGFIVARRQQRRREVVGERTLKLWRSRIGRWLFKLGRLGLKKGVAEGSSTFRPTELAIGMAADRLFEELPKAQRKQLQELPSVVERLEADASRMRARVEDLDRLLADIGADGSTPISHPGGSAAEALPALTARRDALIADLQQARKAAEARLREAVTSLETIRLDLLRMHAGAGSVQGVTANLSEARDLSDEIARLLEGQREVEEALRSTVRRGPPTGS